MSIIKLKLNKFGLKNIPFMINDKDIGLSNQLLSNGLREPINSYFISEMLKFAKYKYNLDFSVLDIGGNIGYFPLIESLCGINEVISFEPIKENFEYLKMNKELNDDFTDNLILINKGVAENRGNCKFFVTNKRNNSSLYRNEKYFDDNNIKVIRTEKVECITLKEACDLCNNDIFVRTDIEGYEYEIFKNIPKNVKALSFELHTKILGYNNSIELIENLIKKGFEVNLMIRELDGLSKIFSIFGYSTVKIFDKLIEKRIFHNPDFEEISEVIGLQLENPHLFMFRC